MYANTLGVLSEVLRRSMEYVKCMFILGTPFTVLEQIEGRSRLHAYREEVLAYQGNPSTYEYCFHSPCFGMSNL